MQGWTLCFYFFTLGPNSYSSPSSPSSFVHLWALFFLVEGYSRLFQNAGKYLPNYMASHRRRQQPSFWRVLAIAYYHFPTEQIGPAVKFWTCIREVQGSNLGLVRHALTEVFRDLSVPPGKCWDNTSIRPRTLPTKSFPVYYSPVNLPFDAVVWNADSTTKQWIQFPGLYQSLPEFLKIRTQYVRSWPCRVGEPTHPQNIGWRNDAPWRGTWELIWLCISTQTVSCCRDYKSFDDAATNAAVI